MKKKKNMKRVYIFIAIVILIIINVTVAVILITNDKKKKPKNNEVITTTTKVAKTTTTESTATTTSSTTSKTTTTTKAGEKVNYGNVLEPTGEKIVIGRSSKGYEIYQIKGITYVDGYLIANKTYGLPEDYNPGALNSTVKSAAAKMFEAAKNEIGKNMWAQSGFRSYSTQKNLYTRYANRDGKEKADTYSARPGYSEHQSGLAFDVCATNKPCITSGFNDTEEAKWLADNAYKYGFILRYVKDKSNETGYKYESWHFRYVGTELAEKLYNNGDWITMEDYFGITSEYQD